MQRPSPGLASRCEGLTTEEGNNFLTDVKNPSAPPHSQFRVAANKHPIRRHSETGGLVHDHTRHTTRFTVIGNHLAQQTHRAARPTAPGEGDAGEAGDPYG
jgi:hypothetical protein